MQQKTIKDFTTISDLTSADLLLVYHNGRTLNTTLFSVVSFANANNPVLVSLNSLSAALLDLSALDLRSINNLLSSDIVFRTDISNLTAESLKWNSVYAITSSLSSQWNSRPTDLSSTVYNLTASSVNWNSVYATTSSLSSHWGSATSTITNILSSNLYTTTLSSDGNLYLAKGGMLGDAWNGGGVDLVGTPGAWASLTSYDKDVWVGVVDNSFSPTTELSGAFNIETNLNDNVNRWAFTKQGDLLLAQNGGIVFDRNNTSIRVGMGFHIASGEGVSIEAIDNADPDNLVSKSWYFSPAGVATFPGSFVASTSTVDAGSNAGSIAIDLTKQINKLVPYGNGTTPSSDMYTLADGIEGQIMYLVPSGKYTNEDEYTTVKFAHARYSSGTNIEETADKDWWLPFRGATTPQHPMVVTLIFTDGHWNLPHSYFD